MLDIIICANFGVEKLRGLGNTRGQILEFRIEMAGHFYNRAGATAQPVILKRLSENADFGHSQTYILSIMQCAGAIFVQEVIYPSPFRFTVTVGLLGIKQERSEISPWE